MNSGQVDTQLGGKDSLPVLELPPILKRATHTVRVDHETWWCPHCGFKIEVEEYDGEKVMVCNKCGHRCTVDSQIDEVTYR